MEASNKKFITTHRRLIGTAGTMVAMIIAIVYFFVVPEKAANADSIAKLILLYGHSTCWLLIACASGLWAARGASRWTAGLLYVALAMYVMFFATMITAPSKPVTTIDNYRACENAGGRIGESYPTQCFIDGKSFVNDQTK